MKLKRVFVLALSASFSVTVAACSKNYDGPAPVPARGTVTLKGAPLPSGNIQFFPADGRPAGGAIKDGKFSLTTYEGDDGAIPGKHTVTVAAYKDVKVPGQTEPQQTLITPEQYASTVTSGISVDIPPTGKTDIQIDLK
jgi:hypothetical protein